MARRDKVWETTFTSSSEGGVLVSPGAGWEPFSVIVVDGVYVTYWKRSWKQRRYNG